MESIAVGQMRIRYLVDGAATGGLGVFELTVPPGSNRTPHRPGRSSFWRRTSAPSTSATWGPWSTPAVRPTGRSSWR